MVENNQHDILKPVSLRQMLEQPDLLFLMEAHNALSARIAQDAGFKALWASGFSIATSLGRRDANELSFSQVLDVCESIVDATHVPILVDGDTGWGNFNNVRQAVRKLCERGVAGICLEDKLFPKLNSFAGKAQPLASIEEFCGKIKAANDSKKNSDFVVVARVEALVSGAPMEDALNRACLYQEAGADAILIHSKLTNASEIISFTSQFNNRCPILIVPTTYHKTETEIFKKIGISGIIWANHNMRASLRAMTEACNTIFANQSVTELEHELPTISDIFKMFDYNELEDSERYYLGLDSIK